MVHIVAEILSLVQHIKTLEYEPEQYRLKYCLFCGKSGIWPHGCYPRKADRSGGAESLNPIFIQRFYCPGCRRTCSVLPECIPPRRWYLWGEQQAVFLLLFAGKNLSAVARKTKPSRHTLKRWLTRIKEQFNLHKNVLCNYFIYLGRTVNYIDFWQTFLKNNLLSCAMRLCHVAGVSIP